MRRLRVLLPVIAVLLFLSSTKKKQTEINAKYIDKRMAHVDSNIYGCIYETTNFEYRSFLIEIP